MSILWIYDKVIDPQAGGTERATHLVMSALADRGYQTAGFLVFRQDPPREICDERADLVDDLYEFLQRNDVHVVINQIGYSKWLLEEFLARGGQRWKDEGGRIVTKLHFDPRMFPTGLSELLRHWRRRSPKQKLRRLARIALLPLERRKAVRILREAYTYLIEQSDHFVVLSDLHLKSLHAVSGTALLERVHSIPNPNTYPAPISTDRVARKTRTVLMVTRLDEPQKRISLALKVWARVMTSGDHMDWALRIVGTGEYDSDYREQVRSKRIPNVEFLGRRDPEPIYEEASIYLHTAKREGWGMTIVEAMQKGAVPIVMDSSPVFGEIIEDGRTGILTKNGDVVDCAARLVELMRDKTLRDRIALNAIESTRRHDLDRIIEKWSEILPITALNIGAEQRPTKLG